MSNVIPFQPKTARPQAHIEIDVGTIVESNDGDIGQDLYLVDVIEADGGRIPMWDGPNYADAKRTAAELSSDYGNAPIIDQVLA